MIKFRNLQDIEKDYLLLKKWLNNNHVRKWYGYDDFPNSPTLSDIKDKYKNKIVNLEKSNPKIILSDTIPIGYIQYYKTYEYLQEENVYGIDLFIGEDNYRGKGYGRQILKQIIKNIFELYNAKKIIVDPNFKNEAAIKCYLNTGFEIIKTVDNNLIMAIEKEIK